MSKDNFLDRFNFVHDRVVENGEASSGNPAIYSAIYQVVTKLLGSPVIYNYDEPYYDHIEQSVRQNYTLWIRHPDRPAITSLDEMIAWIYFGYVTTDIMFEQNWRWYDIFHEPSKLEVVQAIIYCAGKHRNFFWSENVRDIHPVAYWIPWHIQYYLLKKEDKSTGFTAIAFHLWVISVLVKRNYKKVYKSKWAWLNPFNNDYVKEKQTGVISQKNIALVILYDIKSHWLKVVDWKKNLREYFGRHLITEKL